MATQRVIYENVDLPKSISINSAFQASPAGCIIQSTQTISFSNASGSTVAIRFVANPVNPNPPVFNDIPNLPSNNLPSPAQSPNVSNGNGSVNFNVVANGVPYGPFAIQIGQGPLQVLISMGSGDKINVTPPTFAIPAYDSTQQIAGTVEMIPDNAANDYSIGWLNGDPFQPPLTAPDSAPHGDTNTTPVKDYGFTVSSPDPKEGGSGGGTVKVKGN
jgi:hypothetical protein